MGWYMVVLLNDVSRHVATRLTFGLNAQLSREVTASGWKNWLSSQLLPMRLNDAAADAVATWFPRLSLTPLEMWQGRLADEFSAEDVMSDFVRWTLMRRTLSKRQLHELMVDFWTSLLYIPAPVGAAWPHRVAYDRAIRQHALGTFEQLLKTAVTHPGMTCYLTNAQSTKDSLNENLGRELLELHTVGHDANYSESDVLNSARILTGYNVDVWNTWRATYNQAGHYVGSVQVLGFRSTNSDRDGRPVARSYLKYLSLHPETATRVAERLCRRLVSDDPSEAIVHQIATVFRESGTDIKETLRAVTRHPEFLASEGQKLRTPHEDLVATYRSLDVSPLEPYNLTDLATVSIYQAQQIGQHPFEWPRPDGAPDVSDAWLSAGRILASFAVHGGLATATWPRTGVRYVPPTERLPPLPASLAEIVDYLSRQVLFRPVPASLLRAACTIVAMEPSTIVSSRNDITDFQVALLVKTLLDSPQHMTR